MPRAVAAATTIVLALAGALVMPQAARATAPEPPGVARSLHEGRTAAGQPLPPGDSRAATGPQASQLHAAVDRLHGDTARLVVTLRPGASRAKAVASASHLRDAASIDPLAGRASYAVRVRPERLGALRRTLAAQPDVATVVESHRRWASAVPSDSLWSSQSQYLGAVHAPAAWDVTHGSPDVLVAVVDTGVDSAHADLAGKVVATHNAVDGSSTVTDYDGHGTSVASVAAASTGNGIGVAGSGYDTRIIAVKVEDPYGDMWSDAVARGIRWAADNGADIINISLGSETSSGDEESAVAYARSRGVLVVAAAGNEGTSDPLYPAAHPGVVAVGATTADGGTRTYWSNFGSWVDVAAPGDSVWAAASDGGYRQVSGTSFSSPMVAGEAALLLAARPGLSEGALASAVTSTTTGGTLGFAHGLVDFRKALDSLPPSSVPVLTAPVEGQQVGAGVAVAATSSAPLVRFAIPGTAASTTATVVAGRATGTLDSFGLVGPQKVEVRDCSSPALCGAPAAVSVIIHNPPPVLTAPAAGALITQNTLAVSATAGGGAVRFVLDGRVVATDTSSPYAASLSTVARADGTHRVWALQCTRTGAVCDTGHPSAVRQVTVRRLHPAVVGVSPRVISPNGDHVQDATRIDFSLDQPQSASMAVRDARGALVRSRTVGNLPAGRHYVTWTGVGQTNYPSANGRYTVQLSTSRAVQGGVLRGLAETYVVVDRTAPRLTGGAPSTVIHPYPDGYRDTVALSVTVSEPVALLQVQIRNGAGALVQTLSKGARSAGASSLTWNGRTSSGALAPGGHYTARFLSRDYGGIYAVPRTYGLDVSSKRIVQETASRTLSPYESYTQVFVAPCSRVVTPGRSSWPDSVGYYSDY